MSKSRPTIPSIQNNAQTTRIELFQNDTLRPILKQQNQAWQSVFLNHCELHGVEFQSMSQLTKQETIVNYLSKNLALKYQLIGMVIGHFNEKERSIYFENSKEFNKRIWQMLKERLIDQLV